MRSPLLEVRGIEKAYGGNPVLRGIDFSVGAGEAVGLLGENGAGKSTLARILAGAVQPDAGEMELCGETIALDSPREALRHGIAFIPQELATVPDLTVAENLLLGRWPARAGLTSPAAIMHRARSEAARIGLPVDLNQRMRSLRLADQQKVEVLKALVRRASVILLDEPSSALTAEEADALFAVLRRLVADGVGVIHISHRLDEVLGFCDRMVVLRNGRMVASVEPGETSRNDLIALMLGQPIEQLSTQAAARGEPYVRLDGWEHDGLPRIDDLSLEVARGEVVGLFGVLGSGIELVADGLAGRARRLRGRITVDGRTQPMFRSPRAAREAGMAYVPPDRKTEGLALNQTIERNLSLLMLKKLSRFGVLRTREQRRVGTRLLRDFDVRSRGLAQPVWQLSGGNQQKVLLASRLASAPTAIVMHEPTRGVDVGARLQIHRLLRDTAATGVAMLLVTSDVEEAVVVSDRLLVMRDGRIVAELAGAELTQSATLHAATGEER